MVTLSGATMASAPAPHHIVSFNPCTDAILAEVADPAQIAALSTWSSDPVQSSMDVRIARRFPATDGAWEEVVACAGEDGRHNRVLSHPVLR
jgi:hypothetical protein